MLFSRCLLFPFLAFYVMKLVTLEMRMENIKGQNESTNLLNLIVVISSATIVITCLLKSGREGTLDSKVYF